MTTAAVIGRADEQRALVERLTSRPGLVTLVGPGGVGKTTLALEVRATLAEAPGALDGCLFVDLSEASTSDGVIGPVGAALGISVEGVHSALEAGRRIGAALAARGPCLVVLDNVEQVLAPVAALATSWLALAPALRLLVTSREPLGLKGEEVVPLSVLSKDDAMALFFERAARARAGVGISAEERAQVEGIVAELDRLPLALELAAARLEVLSLAQLQERLGQKLKLLRSVDARGPERHRALSATMAWSWELLDDDERRVLAQAAVFRGGFSLEVAEDVLEARADVLDVLQALKRKSLVVFGGPPPRFWLLETVRAFAAEEADALGLRAGAEARHASAFAARVRAAKDPHALDDETDNLIAARRYARAGDPGDAAELGLFLSRLLAPRVPMPLRLSFLDDAVADTERARDPALQGRVRLERGELRRARGDHVGAEEDFAVAERALALADAPAATLAALWSARGALYGQRGDLAAADAALTRAIDASEDAPDVRAVALMRRFALRIVEERLDEAERVGSEALSLLERIGDRRNEAVTLGNLAALRLEAGRPDDACASAERARAVQHALGDPTSECMSLLTAALAHVEAGRPDKGREHASEALAIAERESDRRVAGFAHGARGIALEAEGRLDDAIADLARAEALSTGDDAIAARFHPGSYRAVLLARTGDVVRSESLLAGVDRESGPRGTRAARALLAAAHEVTVAAREGGQRRASAERAARALLEETREVQGVHPRLARRWLERQLDEASRVPAQERVLEIGPEGRFATTPDGARVDLSRRGPTRRLLLALVEARERAPGSGVSVEALIAAGWPNERMAHASAVDRVYACVRQLRLLGFDACLETHDDGYLLDPEIVIRRVKG